MGANGFEVDEPYAFIDGVAKQVELVLATELVDEQPCQIALLALPDLWVVGDCVCSHVDVSRNIVVQLFVGASKATRLLEQIVAHAG